MEKHKCKLCSRTFNNGRALGGHMKSHLAPSPTTRRKLGDLQTESASSSSSSGNKDDKSPVYGLRENPKRSVRVADPEFSFANLDSGSSVIVLREDGESETEPKNPGQRKSKKIRKSDLETKKQKLKKTPSLTESTTESPEPVSSVSDTSPEEDVAMCLMMLSRGVWKRKVKVEKGDEENATEPILEMSEEAEDVKPMCLDSQCKKCNKVFGSHRTLTRHKRTCLGSIVGNEIIFKCPFCDKVFMSGQALGGHKRSHMVGIPSTMMNPTQPKKHLIDLNLPAPLDDDASSVVSDM